MSDQISELRDYCERLDEFQGEIDVAALIEVESPPVVLADERARRRRRWAVIAAAGVAVALGLAGLVAWSAGDERVSTDVGTVDRPTTTGPDEPPTEATADGSSGVVLGGPSEFDVPFLQDFAVPWHGGTLAMEARLEFGPPPEGFLDRWPIEIQELFADGLAETWEEAVERLTAAGLMDVASAAIDADPILAAYVDDTTLANRVILTVDGVRSEIPVDRFPVDHVEAVASDGEHLVLVGQGKDANPIIGMTEDLETWNTEVLVEPTPPDLPAEFVFAPDNPILAVSDRGWALIGSPYLFSIDPDYLVSQGLIGAAEEIKSIETDDSGTLVVTTADRTLQLSAADLGVEGQAWILDRPEGSPYSSGWVAAWGQEPTWSQLPRNLDTEFHVDPSGFYAVLTLEEQDAPDPDEPILAYATSGGDWYPTNPPPGEDTVGVADLGLVSGGLAPLAGSPEFWLSENLGGSWRQVSVTGLDEHVGGLLLDSWPILRSYPRQDAAITVDGYAVVLTYAFASGHDEVISARLEDPATGEVLAEMTFADGGIGFGGFELVDTSGSTLAAVDSRTVNSAARGIDRDEHQDGPSWRVDTSAEPWTAVPMSSE